MAQLRLDEVRSERKRESLYRQKYDQGSTTGLIRRTGIPTRYWTARSLADLESTSDNDAALTTADRFAEAFDQHWQHGVGFTLIGPPGVGKTTIACLVARDLALAGFLVRFTTMAGLIERLQAQFRKPDDEEDLAAWRDEQFALKVMRGAAHLLVIDDVGKEHHTSSGWAQSVFDLVFRERYDEGLPTVLTSNVPLDRWGTEYSEAMASFVHEAAPVVDLSRSRDRRRSASR